MKKILTLLSLFAALTVRGQKTNPCTYKNVDTLVKYKNAETITYRNRTGEFVTDTIWFSKMRCDINIETVDVVIIDEDKTMTAVGQKDTTKIPVWSLCCPISNSIDNSNYTQTWHWSPSQPTGGLLLTGKPSAVYDTTACIMLVCDTTDNPFYVTDNVWWLRGYRVTKRVTVYNYFKSDNSDYLSTPRWEERETVYLDDRKKPLGKNILVWQSREL